MTLLRDVIYALRKGRLRMERRRLDYAAEERARADRLSDVLEVSPTTIRRYEQEYDELAWFHDVYADRVTEIHDAGVAKETTHWRDGKTMYVVCRAVEPSTVIETGVRFGSFDAHILAALERNGRGQLHSLDLPGGPPGPFEYGHLIPDRCRDRWTLHEGDARDRLDDLLESVAPVDVFLHDSDHRLPHMRFEYETALDHLSSEGILASHDVRLSGLFDSVVDRHDLAGCVVCDTGIARIPDIGPVDDSL